MGKKTFIYCPFNFSKFWNGAPASLDLRVCIDAPLQPYFLSSHFMPPSYSQVQAHKLFNL